MRVRVVPYDPLWPARFQAEAGRLRPAFGPGLVDLCHMGSTSVPGLSAKPIIDILAIVDRIATVDERLDALAALGYECLGEYGIPGRRYLRKGGDDRTHQIHAFGRESTDQIERHLAVPAYLRDHPAQAAAYGRLKAAAAALHPEDIEGYMDAKDAFVKALESRALAWARNRSAQASRPRPTR